MSNKVAVKKTGYEDIDTLLFDVHTLLKRGETLKKDIEISLKHKPVHPAASRKLTFKRYRGSIQS